MTLHSQAWVLVATIGVLAALTGYALTQAKRWTDRGITTHLGWTNTVLLATAAGIAAPLGVYPTWGLGPSVAAAAMSWLAVLAIASDIKTMKVPWDVSYPVSLVGLVAFAMNYTFEGLLAFTAAFVGIVGVPLLVRALTRKGLGMSDIRILWAVTATCSWWIGQTWLLYGIMLACFIQALVRLVAAPLNLGRLVPVPNRHDDDDDDHEGQTDTGTTGHATIKPKVRRELPFAPAILTGLTVCIAYGTHTAYGACQMWNIFGVCT